MNKKAKVIEKPVRVPGQRDHRIRTWTFLNWEDNLTQFGFTGHLPQALR